jgi:WD40 repeat protein
MDLTYEGDRVICWGSHDNNIYVLDVTGTRRPLLLGYPEFISAHTLSTDREQIATGDHDLGISIWRVKTGERISKLKGHTEFISSLAFNSDGSKLISGSFDATIRVWDVATSKSLVTLEGNYGKIASVGFTRNWAKIIGINCDYVIHVWDATALVPLPELEAADGVVSLVAFDRDNRRSGFFWRRDLTVNADEADFPVKTRVYRGSVSGLVVARFEGGFWDQDTMWLPRFSGYSDSYPVQLSALRAPAAR